MPHAIVSCVARCQGSTRCSSPPGIAALRTAMIPAQKRGDLVVVLFGVDPSPASTSNGLDADVGFGRLATEEEADASAAERLRRLQTLVLRKRLYFEVLAAAETIERDAPETRKELLAKLSDPEELGELIDDYESRCERIADIDAQVTRLRSLCVALTESPGGLKLVFEGQDVDAVVDSISKKVEASVGALSKCSAEILKSLPYKSLDDALGAVEDATARMDAALVEEGGKTALRPVVKTLERAGTKVKGARGLVKTGVSAIREKPLTAAASAAGGATDADSLEDTLPASVLVRAAEMEKRMRGKRGAKSRGDGDGSTDKPKARKKRKKKVILPKGFDPSNPGPLPDPERWLPLRERSTWKGKRKKVNIRGAQGASSAKAIDQLGKTEFSGGTDAKKEAEAIKEKVLSVAGGGKGKKKKGRR